VSSAPANGRADAQAAAGGDGVDWDAVHAIDLVYVQDCHRLCGDAHCCSFARHKARFRMLAQQPFQELPLLPGEYEHMAARGAWAQFGECERRSGAFVLEAAREFFTTRRHAAHKKQKARFNVAILHDPDERESPSNARALDKFVKAGESLDHARLGRGPAHPDPRPRLFEGHPRRRRGPAVGAAPRLRPPRPRPLARAVRQLPLV
jgi:hypothetical protein